MKVREEEVEEKTNDGRELMGIEKWSRERQREKKKRCNKECILTRKIYDGG